jgi:hypothetical protein
MDLRFSAALHRLRLWNESHRNLGLSRAQLESISQEHALRLGIGCRPLTAAIRESRIAYSIVLNCCVSLFRMRNESHREDLGLSRTRLEPIGQERSLCLGIDQRVSR